MPEGRLEDALELVEIEAVLVEELPALGAAAQLAQQPRLAAVEGPLVLEGLADTARDVLAAGLQILLEGLAVAGELAAELLDELTSGSNRAQAAEPVESGERAAAGAR